jgi:hypothetical protein
MTDTGHYSTDAGASRVAYSETEPTGWTGWVVFGGFMMILLGTFQAIEGLVAIFDKGYYLVSAQGLVVQVDYTVWGWVHLLLGVIVAVSGVGVLAGNVAARAVGVVLAMGSAVLNLVFIAAYPVWSTIVIAVDVLVIYALTVHGRELRPDRRP